MYCSLFGSYHVLPDFYIIGFVKCGTTSLYEYLISHPNVYPPKGKEIDYIETPVPTNVGFGRGKDANLLYITAGNSLYQIRLNAKGYHLPAKKK